MPKRKLSEPLLIAIVPGLLSICATIITAITSVATTIIQTNASKLSDQKLGTETNTQNVIFTNISEKTSSMNFEYINCSISSDPPLPAYQVRVYPYLTICGDEQDYYYPITGLYTQPQYVADTNGVCTLLKTDDLDVVCEFLAQENNDISPETGTILLMQYSTNNTSFTEAYELRNGQLITADDTIAIIVLNAFDSDSYTINLNVWPVYKYEFLEELKTTMND